MPAGLGSGVALSGVGSSDGMGAAVSPATPPAGGGGGGATTRGGFGVGVGCGVGVGFGVGVTPGAQAVTRPPTVATEIGLP